MIRGVGVDIVDIRRIRGAIERFGDRFARRLLSDAEMPRYAAAADPGRHLAKQFAAKEAIAKALGTGLRGQVALRSIEVLRDPLGKPVPRLAIDSAAGLSAHVSLSDEEPYAVAFAIIETAGGPPTGPSAV